MRHSFHNDRTVTILVIGSKPVEFKVKLELCLKIENCPARLLRVNACVDEQMHVVDALHLMRSWEAD